MLCVFKRPRTAGVARDACFDLGGVTGVSVGTSGAVSEVKVACSDDSAIISDSATASVGSGSAFGSAGGG